MSQSGGTGEVGRINVAFTGDASGAVAAAAAAKKAFDDAAASAQNASASTVEATATTTQAVTAGADAQATAGAKVVGVNEATAASAKVTTTAVVDNAAKIPPALDRPANSFVKFGDSVRQTIAPVRGFVNAIRSIGGTITGVVGIFAFWATAIATVITLLQKLAEIKIDEGVVKRVEALSGQADRGVIESIGARRGTNTEAIQTQLTRLREVQTRLNELQSLSAAAGDDTTAGRAPFAYGVRGGSSPVFDGFRLRNAAELAPEIQSLQEERTRLAREIGGVRNASRESAADRTQEDMLRESRKTNIKLDKAKPFYINFGN